MSSMAFLRACTQALKHASKHVCGKAARARMIRRKKATTMSKPTVVLGRRSTSPSVARGTAALGLVMRSIVNKAFTIVQRVGAWRLLVCTAIMSTKEDLKKSTTLMRKNTK